MGVELENGSCKLGALSSELATGTCVSCTCGLIWLPPLNPRAALGPRPPHAKQKTDNQTIEYNLQNIVSTPTVWLWVFGSLGEQVCCLFS